MVKADVRRAFAVGDAKKLWRTYGFQTPKELVLEDLAWAMGVAVFEAPLDSADARLVRGPKRGIIRINRDIQWRSRKRFAIAHELGHWCLHAKISQLLACTTADMRAKYKDSEPEAEANWFAAELLMPEFLFGPAIRGTMPAAGVINRLAADFDVSHTAAAVRYAEMCTAHSVFVMCVNGRIKWWRCSKELEGPLWILPGSQVSPRTLAGKYFAGQTSLPEVQPVGMGEWADRHPEWAEDAMETVIPLGSTGAAIVMIWLE